MINKEQIIATAERLRFFPNVCIAGSNYSLDMLSDKKMASALKFLSISSSSDLCFVLNESFESIQSIINKPEYKEFDIKKKSGRKRRISQPNMDLMDIQGKLNTNLQAYYSYIRPEPVHGFVSSRYAQKCKTSIVTNALPHVGRRNLYNVDIKDFFTSISAKQVYELFIGNLFKFNDNIAKSLTFLCTYNGSLPTGSPSSPIISNFIMYEADRIIYDFCEELNITYTRYADDLSFSSDIKFNNDIITKINNLIENSGFTINKNKQFIKSNNSRMLVTGLVINEKVNVNRQFYKKTRAMMHDYKTNGLEVAAKKHFELQTPASNYYQMKFLQKLNGYVEFIGMVRGKDDGVYGSLVSQLNSCVFDGNIEQ